MTRCGRGAATRFNSEPRATLGRFGLGLKTASFSQARRLTVATRQVRAPVVVRCWDLDHIGRTDAWELLTAAPPGSQPRIKAVEDVEHVGR